MTFRRRRRRRRRRAAAASHNSISRRYGGGGGARPRSTDGGRRDPRSKLESAETKRRRSGFLGEGIGDLFSGSFKKLSFQ